MNAKERLRAYLEQRRELGESEMMLDALDVDDVMRMLGALPGSAGEHAAPSVTGPDDELPAALRLSKTHGSTAAPMPPVAPTSAPPRARVPDPQERVVFNAGAPDAPTASGDWHEVMRNLQSGSQSDGTGKPPAPPPPAQTSHPVTPDAAPRDESMQALPHRAPLIGTLRVEGLVVPLGLRIERPALQSAAAAMGLHALADVTAAITSCTRCSLHETATQPVPGIGNPVADVMVIGDAPREVEDLGGEPFGGPAGELLDKILAAVQLSRASVYLCNVMNHRTPGDRQPMPDEIRACSPFLQRQIDLVQPKLIIAFGTFTAQSLLGTKLPMGKLRQQIHWYQGIPLVATYHPAALLRNDAWKRPTWEDVKLARRVLDATIRA